MKPDLVAVIEAAYQVERSESAWLDGVLSAATPLLDLGMGCSAFFYDARDVERLRIHRFVTQGERPDEMIVRAIERSAPERVQWVFRTQACRLASEGPDWRNQPAAKLFASWGIDDVLFVNGLDPSGLGCFLTAKLGARCKVPSGTKRRWSRLAAHLASGYRLQRRLTAATADRPDAPAAILQPNGKLEHAEGEATESTAREALRSAVVAIEAARGKLRQQEPDGAVERWRGLVAARWSLVDEFERDGKRFVVARRNDVAGPDTRRLTDRERQVVAYARLGHSNKFIAYELGISPSTIGVLLWRAAAKVGARSRRALLEALDAHAERP